MDIDEFIKKLDVVQKEFPNEAEEVVKKNANEFKKILAEATPNSGHDHNKKLKKAWKVEMKGLTARSIAASIKSKSPLMHLLEDGHELVIKGKHRGFVQGRKFIKRSVQEHKSNIQEKMVKQLFKKVKGRL